MVYDEEFPLGFITGENNTFTLKATEIRNFDSSVRIILKDKLNLLNPEHELNEGVSYSFPSDITSSTDRFSIIFRAPGTVSNLNKNQDNANVWITKNAQNQIRITMNSEISQPLLLTVYNSLGQKMVSSPIENATTFINSVFRSGVYILEISGNGKTRTEKFVIN